MKRLHQAPLLAIALISGLLGWIVMISTPTATAHGRLVASGTADRTTIAGSAFFLAYGFPITVLLYSVALGALVTALLTRRDRD